MNLSRPAKQVSVGLAALLLLVLGSGLRAATLEDYDGRLARVIASLTALQSDSGHERRGGTETAAAADLELVRRTLPAKEIISFRGQTIAVDNSWLEDELAEYEKQTKATDRDAALSRIVDRLRAIQESVRKLKDANGQPGDKDAEKGRMAEILRRPDYLKAAPETNALQKLIERFLNWLDSLVPKPKRMRASNARWLSNVIQILIIAACAGLIVFLIWRFAPRLLTGRRRKLKKREARIVLGERLEPDQTAADLMAQAEDMAREGNLRGAIRKAYIALLCELGDRRIISLAQFRTNRDYLNAVRDKGSLYTSMRRLTNMFELHWYGFTPAGPGDWDEFRNGYRKIFRNEQE
ncbi:MAG TPA: DUF4129 domain-containing protein [Pyrinomonadaceae bacterium]|nr:DUF4129 domain-containing protein [Pyrinomonadaceae bacterium]